MFDPYNLSAIKYLVHTIGNPWIDISQICAQKNLCKTGILKKTENWFSRPELLLNADQKYCRMLQGEHSAILSTCIKLPFINYIFVLSFFEWPFYTGFTVAMNVGVMKNWYIS